MNIKIIGVGKLKEKYFRDGIAEYLKRMDKFAKVKIVEVADEEAPDITFVIGGSLGLSPAVMKRANDTLSFGKLTMPHQLMRLVLMEQIYRAFMINIGSPYHK